MSWEQCHCSWSFVTNLPIIFWRGVRPETLGIELAFFFFDIFSFNEELSDSADSSASS